MLTTVLHLPLLALLSSLTLTTASLGSRDFDFNKIPMGGALLSPRLLSKPQQHYADLETRQTDSCPNYSDCTCDTWGAACDVTDTSWIPANVTAAASSASGSAASSTLASVTSSSAPAASNSIIASSSTQPTAVPSTAASPSPSSSPSSSSAEPTAAPSTVASPSPSSSPPNSPTAPTTTPAASTTIAPAPSSVSSSAQVTCTLWTQCPPCGVSQSPGCFGDGGPMVCVCWDNNK
ncbi:hypothetical protein MMC20_003741 [Loxospora ochrophaea]|nr:hypothetical protein [Loxospora ochrophaea]